MIPTFLPAMAIAFSSGLKAFGLAQSGNDAVASAKRRQQANEFEAQQLDINANQSIGAAQRVAFQKGQEGDLMLSRLKALAAASGGGATDPTVLNLQAGLMHQKAYNLASALYSGEEQARSMRMQAAGKRYSGALGVSDAEDTKRGYDFAAIGSLASGGSSLFEKYGDKTPGFGGVGAQPY